MTSATASLETLSISVEAIKHTVKTSPAAEGRIYDMLAGIFNTAKRVFGATSVDLKASSKELGFTGGTAYRKITPSNFYLYAEKKIETAPGFSGLYVDYGTLLDSMLHINHKALNEGLTFYTALLGKIINSPGERASWIDVTRQFRESETRRGLENNVLSTFWRGPKDNSTTTVSSVIQRTSDLALINQTAEDLVAKIKGYKLQELIDRMEVVTDLSEALAKDVKDGKYPGITSAQVNNMASGVLELANQAEQFSVAVYNATVFLTMVKNLQEAAKQVV